MSSAAIMKIVNKIEQACRGIHNWQDLFHTTTYGVVYKPTGHMLSFPDFAAMEKRLTPPTQPLTTEELGVIRARNRAQNAAG